MKHEISRLLRLSNKSLTKHIFYFFAEDHRSDVNFWVHHQINVLQVGIHDHWFLLIRPKMLTEQKLNLFLDVLDLIFCYIPPPCTRPYLCPILYCHKIIGHSICFCIWLMLSSETWTPIILCLLHWFYTVFSPLSSWAPFESKPVWTYTSEAWNMQAYWNNQTDLTTTCVLQMFLHSTIYLIIRMHLGIMNNHQFMLIIIYTKRNLKYVFNITTLNS